MKHILQMDDNEFVKLQPTSGLVPGSILPTRLGVSNLLVEEKLVVAALQLWLRNMKKLIVSSIYQ